jgi:peptidyl-prolyl cis-trans isomerase C
MTMRQLRGILVLSVFVLAAACTKPAGDTDQGASTATATNATTIATVDGKKISSDLLDVLSQATTGKPIGEATPEQKERMVEQLISIALASQEAEKDGKLKDPAMRARLDLLQMQLLAGAASEKFDAAHPVTEEEIKAEYAARVASLPKEYRARHILVEQKATAESLIRDLQAGGDFAKLAATESKDPVSAQQGGELDWFALNAMVKPFGDAVAALQVGQVTPQPVQTNFGWHVIQLEEVRTPTPPDFESVKERVKGLVQQKKFQAHLDEIRKTAKIQKS